MTRASFRRGQRVLLLLLTLSSFLTTGPTFAQNPTDATAPPLSKADLKNRPDLQFLATTAIQNSQIGGSIADTGRFNLGAFDAAGSWTLSFGWPGSPATSFTSLRIDGQDYLYGGIPVNDTPPAPTGSMLLTPTNLSATSNESAWLINGIKVTQRLEIVANPNTAQDDVVRISYTAENTTASAHTVGLRMMIDTQVNENDATPFRIANDVITTQREFVTPNVPDTLDVLASASDTIHVGVITLNGGDATPPDRLLLTTRSSAGFDDSITEGMGISDSAYAVYWLPITVAAGASRTVVSYYGLSSITVASPPPPTPPTPPAYTVSYYEGTVDTRIHRKQGCLARQRGEQGIVILTYGSPRGPTSADPSLDQSGNATYGAGLKRPKGSAPPATLDEVQRAVHSYIDGYSRYQDCDQEFGIKIPVSAGESVADANLVVAVGMSNSPLSPNGVPELNPALNLLHGQEWGKMVNRISDYIDQKNYFGLLVAGAYDAEPEWWEVYENGEIVSKKQRTLDWANGFTQEANGILYNFGSLDGTPRVSSWLAQPNNDEMDTLLALSWGRNRRSIPQSYYLPFAKEWYQLKYYSHRKRAIPMLISGTLTQAQSSRFASSVNPASAIANDQRIWSELVTD